MILRYPSLFAKTPVFPQDHPIPLQDLKTQIFALQDHPSFPQFFSRKTSQIEIFSLRPQYPKRLSPGPP